MKSQQVMHLAHWRFRFSTLTTLALSAHDKVRDMSNWFADKLGPDPRRAGQQNLSGQKPAPQQQRAPQPQAAAPQQRQQQAAPQPAARAPEPPRQQPAPPPKAAQPAPPPPEEKKKKKGWF